jgi:hypothetical protein
MRIPTSRVLRSVEGHKPIQPDAGEAETHERAGRGDAGQRAWKRDRLQDFIEALDGLRGWITKEPGPTRADGLLEIVHFASCGLAILVLAVILPVSPAAVVAVGMTAALASYVALSIVRGSFEDEWLESDR